MKTVAIAALALVTAVLLAVTPAVVDFGVALGASMCWCLWLEHHPST